LVLKSNWLAETYDNKKGRLEVNGELEIIDTGSRDYIHRNKEKTNRGGERLLAFLKRQANVIGLYILFQNRLCYRKEYFARIKKMDSVRDGEV
jgi:hypothetical protein